MMLEVDEEENCVFVWGDGSIDELLVIIKEYKDQGFNKVLHGDQNSTLCLLRETK